MNEKQKSIFAGLPVLVLLAAYAVFFADPGAALTIALWWVLTAAVAATVAAYVLAGRNW
ncbi:hypothetical protein [Zhihengliuella flava]|uniref:Uncharacterized protein n=1 Tax=Zhihengliuella flava TaxID=1285193 RepID=A0A931DFF4_9MICC|nr:hypothetical protein [Zhihengliuella flava]MBG6085797.1 hypothetical protein [Zhihengliuella flava]MBG6085875.1 hypothetical protein [Zhihengliuella flava]